MVVGGSRCVLADGECAGRLEWHHCVSKSRLKRFFKYGAWRMDSDEEWTPLRRGEVPTAWDWALTLNAIIADPRNRVWLCSRHHELVTNGRVEVTLPQSVWDFAVEFGLTAQLENDLARRAA